MPEATFADVLRRARIIDGKFVVEGVSIRFDQETLEVDLGDDQTMTFPVATRRAESPAERRPRQPKPDSKPDHRETPKADPAPTGQGLLSLVGAGGKQKASS
ncbi:MAG: hypothetical protein ACYC9Q_14650 [Bacillota bacterium]